MSTDKVLEEIKAEREYQEKRWGTANDDLNTSNDWITYIVKYVGKGYTFPFTAVAFRKSMVQVAALAVAAIEWTDRVKPEPMLRDWPVTGVKHG